MKLWKVADFGTLKGMDQAPWGERFSQGLSQDSDEPTLTGLLFHKLLAKRKELSPNSKPWPSTIVRAMLLIKVSKLGRIREIAHMLKSLLLLASDVSTSVWIWF